MRIWDINPGYLNRQSLLGEHRELHGIVSILSGGKKGYSRHPETLRWAGYGWALKQRHRLLAAEMALRGYTDRTPVKLRSNTDLWPWTYIDEPCRQFELLAEKYRTRGQGRIRLPKNAQQLWAQHKYSVLARDVNLYKELGKDLAGTSPALEFRCLAAVLVEALRKRPGEGGLRNALQHMWGHVSDIPPEVGGKLEIWSLERLLLEIRSRSMAAEEPYLVQSTALSDLAAWL